MHRLFETSTTRPVRELDGAWSFVTDPDDIGRDAGYPTAFPDDATELHVPCAWNAVPKFYEYEGPAWYRRRFRIHERTNARLTFMAVAHDAEVFLDGERLGEHYGGYTPFSFVLDGLPAGEHELVLRVDNTHGDTTIPKPHVDWAHYGGITRPVVLETLPDWYIADVRFEYEIDGDTVHAAPRIEVECLDGAGERELAVFLDGERRATETVALDISTRSTTHTLSFDLEDPVRWSPDDPSLHEYRVTLGDDDQCGRVGFRTIEVTPTAIEINGEPVDIQGVNRHEDHPEWGHAVPPRLVKRDIDIIEDAGFDGVRTSHYPNHPLFLDYCDREGLVVIEEIPYWHYDSEDFEREPVLDRGQRMLREMVVRDYDHPSIVAWSLHNECETQETGVAEATDTLARTTRSIDTSRPLTYATNKHYLGDEENSTAPIDFLCINGYWGWYSEAREWSEFLGDIHEEFPDMPIVVSEFGAGAVAGERNFDRRKWSERRQADVLEEAIRTFDETAYVTGYFIWQYCDANSCDDLMTGRPKMMNNKGIVDAYRQPKEAFWVVRDLQRQ